MDYDVSEFCTIENLIWVEKKPTIEMELGQIILFEHIIEEELFEICCNFIGNKTPVDCFFGKLKNIFVSFNS